MAVAGRADSAVAVAVRFISMSGCGLFSKSDVQCSSYFFVVGLGRWFIILALIYERAVRG